jgi:hypothetical protein
MHRGGDRAAELPLIVNMHNQPLLPTKLAEQDVCLDQELSPSATTMLALSTGRSAGRSAEPLAEVPDAEAASHVVGVLPNTPS